MHSCGIKLSGFGVFYRSIVLILSATRSFIGDAIFGQNLFCKD